jgi:alginate O-acetyltransferase complex protein AlgI
MLFNSFEFIFLFLPGALALYFLAGRYLGRGVATVTLSLCSMVFYAYWNWVYLLLILAEVGFCYGVGIMLTSARMSPAARRLTAIGAVGLILAVLGYFKYTNFALQTLNAVAATHFPVLAIVLPLGISFHSFQQIAYLIDAYRGAAPRYDFGRYCLFVTFFPQLIAGPIVHHHELIPQLADRGRLTPRLSSFTVGLAIFAVGLFKKTILADSLAQIATPIFTAADLRDLTAIEAWCGALAYTFQLYFDFSAYSDMAIGLARMFNLRLPINFYSPYKATSIRDFWRRWHITLSRFLRDYVYIPLGGNRNGPARRTINLLLTMLLGGLWHGAGWTFVIWGGLHGLALVVQAAWSQRFGPGRNGGRRVSPTYRAAAWALTFLFVVVAWVFFRAADFGQAASMLRSMALAVPEARSLSAPLLKTAPLDGWPLLLIAGAIAFLAPNTMQLFRRYRPALIEKVVDRSLPTSGGETLLRRLAWRPTLGWSLATGLMFGLSVAAVFGWRSEFLYFQF